VPDPKKLEEMARFNEELGKAVKILSLNGLHPLYTGRACFVRQRKPTVTDGPFIETKEVLGGYWMVEPAQKKKLVKWYSGARRRRRRDRDPSDFLTRRTSSSRNRRAWEKSDDVAA
jgi:hypothetical protein